MYQLSSASLEFIEWFPVGVFVTEKDTTILHVNGVAESLFGYKTGELIGQKIEVLIPNEIRKRHLSHIENFANAPRKMNMSNRHGLMGVRKDGTHFSLDISLAPVINNGKTTFLAIVQDLSAKEYIKTLQDRNKELLQFTYIASHDLQEPLKTTISLTDFITNTYKDQYDETFAKSLNYISEAVYRMSNLVKGLLDHSRLDQKKDLEVVDCDNMVSNVLTDLVGIIKTKNAKIVVEDLPCVLGYKTELRLLFQNLISNALKFLKENVPPSIHIGYFEDAEYHTFSIKDNGIGIPEDAQDKIFNIFSRLHSHSEYSGTGIGLAHCKKIIDNHQGTISVASKLSEGSKFIFNIRKSL